MENDLSNLPVSELRQMCKERGISCPLSLKKIDIIKLLEKDGAQESPAKPAKKKVVKKKTILEKDGAQESPAKPAKKKVVKKKTILKKSKPSIFAHIQKIEDVIENYEKLNSTQKSNNRAETLEYIEDSLQIYNWDIAPDLKKRAIKFSEKLTKEQDISVDKSSDDDTSTDISEDLEVKPNIGQRIQYVKRLLRILDGQPSALKTQTAQELKEIYEKYDWTDYKNTKKRVEDTLNPPKTETRVDKKSPPPKEKSNVPKYIPGVYKLLDLDEDIKFVNKGKKTKVYKKISITFDEFRNEIKKPEFIKAFTKSSIDLMKAKIIVYQKKLDEMQKEYESLKMRVFKLQSSGIAWSTIKELYPGYSTMAAYIIDLEDIIELVTKKSETINEKDISEGLEDALEDPDDGIAALMGRNDVKDKLASQLYSFSKGYRTFFGNFNNIMITGPAGSGKTRLAKTISFAFSRSGILARDIVKIVTRTDLVGQHIGETAPKTRGALLETLEGILFLDEGYQLTPCPESRQGSRDFGSESITEIVNFLDKYISLNIVIVAGYEELMNRCFMTANEGLPRRFPYRYALSSYNISELTDILVNNLKRKVRDGVKIDDETGNFLYSIVNKLFTDIPEVFNNQAGDMLNLSSNINNAINSSYQVQWIEEDLKNNKKILLAGFTDFLDTKGYEIEL